MIRFAKAALCVAVLSVVAMLAIDSHLAAFAADAAEPETVAHATSDTTKITWAYGAVVSQWANAAGTLIFAIATWLLRKLPGQMYSILVAMRADQIIQKGIDYAINMVKGATKDQVLTVDVHNAVLAQALQYVLGHAPGWLQDWMGGPDQIAQKIIARLNLAADATPDIDRAVAAATPRI